MDFNKIQWNKKTYQELIKYLYSLEDKKYKEFNKKIVRTNYEMIGIRIPYIRKLAKNISKSDFRKLLSLIKDSKIYEVILLEGLLISYLTDFDEVSSTIIKYSKKIDSWAFTDMIASSLKIFKKYHEKGFLLIKELINEKDTFSKRLGYVLLLDYYINQDDIGLIFDLIKEENSKEYYVQMAVSWLLAEMFIKFEHETYTFLKDNKLDDFIIKKTISKINESYRVTKDKKIEVKKLN